MSWSQSGTMGATNSPMTLSQTSAYSLLLYMWQMFLRVVLFNLFSFTVLELSGMIAIMKFNLN